MILPLFIIASLALALSITALIGGLFLWIALADLKSDVKGLEETPVVSCGDPDVDGSETMTTKEYSKRMQTYRSAGTAGQAVT